MMRAQVIDAIDTADELKRLANRFNDAAKRTASPMLRRNAAQLRFVAVLVMNGTYSPHYGREWVRAGRITLNRRGIQ